jgi:hypothetical protein
MQETNWRLPKPVEAHRNCHTRQRQMTGAVGGRVADALTNKL